MTDQIMSNMRYKQLKQVVCNHTTGHAEADMLGNVLIWVERLNRPHPHMIHRKKLKGYTFLSRSEVAKMIRRKKTPSILKRVSKWFKTSLRNWKTIPGTAQDDTPKYLSGLRKNKRNR